MKITRTKTAKAPHIDLKKMAPTIAAAVMGHVRDRTNGGLDVKDRPFEPYSEEYLFKLSASGQDTKVDLQLTGGMLNAFDWLGEAIKGDVLILTFGVKPSHTKNAYFYSASRKKPATDVPKIKSAKIDKASMKKWRR